MTFYEYWAAMRVANPELDEDINTDSAEFFNEEEKEQISDMLRKYG